ncbi:DUF2304 family protein [Candidatus Woesearchaeota archaeon]|nr:DUF2304 family protein [Candidatus Woesearchaeota archaeon]
MITILQILAIIFALFAWSRAVLRFKDKKITSYEFGFWTSIWMSVIIVAFFPDIIRLFSNIVGINRPVDIIIYSSIVLIFYLLFRIYVKIETLDQNLTVIVREMALLKKKK